MILKTSEMVYSDIDRISQVFSNKVSSLDYMVKNNEQLNRTGLVWDINIDQTFGKLETAKPGDGSKIIDYLKLETRNLKRSMGLPIKESYLEALNDGAVIKTNDYLQWLEETIIKLQDVSIEDAVIVSETKTDAVTTNMGADTDEEKRVVSAKYKELTGKSVGRMNIDTIKQKIQEFESV